MKTNSFIIAALVYLILCFGCKSKTDASKFNAYFGGPIKSNGFLKMAPLEEDEAKDDIDSFYTKIKLKNSQMKCFVDIKSVDSLLYALKALKATGIRIYSAAYTKTTADRARNLGIANVRESDYHFIVVAIDDKGNEIKSDDNGNTAINNFNNDCPYNCPTDAEWKTISLIKKQRQTLCNQ